MVWFLFGELKGFVSSITFWGKGTCFVSSFSIKEIQDKNTNGIPFGEIERKTVCVAPDWWKESKQIAKAKLGKQRISCLISLKKVQVKVVKGGLPLELSFSSLKMDNTFAPERFPSTPLGQEATRGLRKNNS